MGLAVCDRHWEFLSRKGYLLSFPLLEQIRWIVGCLA